MSAARGGWLALAGRVVVVTGAASGIGAAVAEGAARLGARVALLDRDGPGAARHAARLAAEGADTLALQCDIADEAAVAAAAARVERELGPADGLVNNAGMLRAGALGEVSLADWNAVLGVNLTGYLLCSRSFGAQMTARGRGSIVNIASIAACHPQTRSGAYSASKAGVLLLSRQMAAEWGPLGVRSNAVCPGMIRTALSEKFYEQPGFEQKRAAITASRRIGRPDDIADVALFLLSDRAGYVNGAELMVDGGMSSMLMDLVPRPGFNDTGAERQAAAA
ncbi:SDR family NAD(P)-dependent oxidoreductase [Derxia gummosa]|uniref:SDR family NAD(P)-dependent oxidoreductase n=1 Tax=Derxia gummosa DSM 723 TaxID=1121388 RepID=A0A8B6X3A8_9BURK|nr:SDR family oxidoreductase [Derxia gummosa]